MSLDRNGLENLFWEILRAFEDLALQQYERYLPVFATTAKREFVGQLAARAPHMRTLEASEIAAPVAALLAEAKQPDELHTLIVQGLILENLAQAIYSTVDQNPKVDEKTRHLATVGHAASMSVTEQLPVLLPPKFADSEELFQEFAQRSHEILTRLDALGDGVDRLFGDLSSLRISPQVRRPSDSDLQRYGMVRRKVVSHLAGPSWD
jgi:hypothetical protein